MAQKNPYKQDINLAVQLIKLVSVVLFQLGKGALWLVRHIREEKLRQQEASDAVLAKQDQTPAAPTPKELARARAVAALDADLSPAAHQRLDHQLDTNSG